MLNYVLLRIKKIEKLYDSSLTIGQIYFSNDQLQDFLIFQQIFKTVFLQD